MLSDKMIEAMRQVAQGADVYSFTTARALRAVETVHPEYIDIGPAMAYSGDGADRMPYFGACLTAKGREVVGKKPMLELSSDDAQETS